MPENILDCLEKIPTINRLNFGTDKNNKPNNYCNWERLLPTLSSEFGWVENDEHFRDRIKASLK